MALGAVLEPAGDMDEDGRSDLWVADPWWGGGGGAVWLVTSVPAGTSTILEVASLLHGPYGEFSTTYAGSSVATGDLDGDGSPEVCVAGSGVVYINQTEAWFP